MNEALRVWAEETPNPQSRKFLVNQKIADGMHDFQTSEDAVHSPLATKLFGFPWMQAVFIGENFITITKQDWVDWAILEQPLCGLLKEHIQNKEAIVLDKTASDEALTDTDDVRLIKRVLEREIRPQVALDGGDVVFHKYEDGVLQLRMLGACNGCPSSSQTLKLGIEVRLKEVVPEIKEVIGV
ncbi:MAG: NifU family protein [Bdellovibrionales bacterium]|nr:NifU family protein [Bdellovibrionales bacterium]